MIEPKTCPALSVSNLACGYPSNRTAIENVSFDVHQGERLAIIGPNGAGKSTLFKSLVGIIPHYTGHISIHGEDCRISHTMIGYVPQINNIDWSFPVTVFDVVMMGRARNVGWFRWPGRKDREAVNAALEQVGLSAFATKQIGELSGGQQRRAFIGRALVQDTDVLLLDEPFNGVDVTGEHEIMEVLDRLQSAGITTLLATHDLNLAATRFDRVLLLHNTVIAHGIPNEVLRHEILQQAYHRSSEIFLSGETALFIPTNLRHEVTA